MAEGSLLLRAGFVALTALLVAGFVGCVQRIAPERVRAALAGSLGWVALTGALAASGLLSFESRPPTMVALLFAMFALVLVLGRSALGLRLAQGLPLALLVGFQGFRVAVELLMHRAYVEGLMPVQMSYEGRNLDIVSGLTALVVAGALWLGGSAPWTRWLAGAWNVLGIALLANIVGVAMLSAPTPLRRFFNEPANTWVCRLPWVWLPAVFVACAALGHVLLTRRLLVRR
jgi:hypothetical protein